MAKRSRFRAPRLVTSWAIVQRALYEIQEALDSATRSPYELGLNITDFTLRANTIVRVSPRAAGLKAVLPAAGPENAGEKIEVIIENPLGPFTVYAAPNQVVDGASAAQYTVAGYLILVSNGVDAWNGIVELPAGTGSAADAEYLLRTAHGSLPNARVADDSTEIDLDYAAPGLVSWFLKTASVGFSKLANLTGLSVLGRSANSDGVMAAITAGTDGHVLRRSGTTLGFGTVANAGLANMAAGTQKGRQIDAGTGAPVDLTGAEQFENLRLVTTQSTGAVSGTLDITLNADTTRLVIQSTADCTLNTISGYEAGRILLVEHVRSSGSGVLTIAHNAAGAGTSIFGAGSTAVGPLGNRTHALLVGDAGAWKVVAIGPSRATSAVSGLVQASTSLVMSGAEMQRAALTGDVTASQNSNATTIANDAVTNAKAANMAEATIKLRAAGAGTGDPTDGTVQQVLAMIGTGRAGNLIVYNGVSWALVDELLTEEFWTNTAGTSGNDFGQWNWYQPNGVTTTHSDTRIPGHPGVVRQTTGAGALSIALAQTSSEGGTGDRGEILGEDIAFFRVIVRITNPDSVANPLLDTRFGVGLAFYDESDEDAQFSGNVPNMGGYGIALFKRANNAEWDARFENNSSVSQTDTGVTVAADTWYEAVFVQTSPGTWNVYINGTLRNTGQTGGPQGVGMVPIFWCDDAHVSETRYWQIDLIQVGLRFTNPRYD